MEVFNGEGISSFLRYLALPTNLLYDFAISSSPPFFSLLVLPAKFQKLVPGLVSVGDRETVRAPCVAIRITLVRLYNLFADLKSVAPPNPNYLVTDARLRAASPTLF